METVDKLFLPSEIEVSGTTDYSCEGEGEIYEYFKNADMFNKWTWLRSPYPINTNYFASWYINGCVNGNGANSTRAVALCFCL